MSSDQRPLSPLQLNAGVPLLGRKPIVQLIVTVYDNKQIGLETPLDPGNALLLLAKVEKLIVDRGGITLPQTQPVSPPPNVSPNGK